MADGLQVDDTGVRVDAVGVIVKGAGEPCCCGCHHCTVHHDAYTITLTDVDANLCLPSGMSMNQALDGDHVVTFIGDFSGPGYCQWLLVLEGAVHFIDPDPPYTEDDYDVNISLFVDATNATILVESSAPASGAGSFIFGLISAWDCDTDDDFSIDPSGCGSYFTDSGLVSASVTV